MDLPSMHHESLPRLDPGWRSSIQGAGFLGTRRRLHNLDPTLNPRSATTCPQKGSNSFVSITLICTTRRWIPASASTHSESEKGILISFWELVVTCTG